MKLSVNVIYTELKRVCPQTVLYSRNRGDNELVLPCPHYVDGDVQIQPNRIYVARAQRLKEDRPIQGHCLLITPEPVVEGAISDKVSVIVAEGVGLTALYNRVLSIFDRYAEWDAMLQDLVFINAPLEEYLKCSFPLIGNSMTVHNNDFAYIARVKEYAPEGDFIDPEFLFKADLQNDQSVFSTREAVHFRDGDTSLEYLFLNLFNGNTVTGRLVVVNDHHPFGPEDSALIRHMGRYLEATLAYAAFSGAGKDVRRDSLLELLQGQRHSEDKSQHLQAVSPWSKLQADQKLYCLVGICPDSEVAERYIAYRLERALPEAVSVLFQSRIIVLCANQTKQTQKEFFEQVGAVLQQYGVTAGCSDPFTNVMDLIYYYRQAEFALGQADLGQSVRKVTHFKDHKVEYILRFGCSAVPRRLICAECIQALAEHDKTASVSYCDSLREYLNAGMNSAEAARRLNIRRNTFLARMERIMRYVDLDLEKEEDRLYILFSLRMLQD